jgi:hypothetical protein
LQLIGGGDDPVLDGLLGTATVIFESGGDAIGVEDDFDFNDKKGQAITNWAKQRVRASRAANCGTSGNFHISGGVGR